MKRMWQMLHIIVQYLSKLTWHSILYPCENFRIEFASQFSKLSSARLIEPKWACLVLSNLPSTLDMQLLQESTTFVQVLSNLLTCLTSEKKNFLPYKVTNSTQHLIPVKNSWTMQIQDTVIVDSPSGN